MQVLSRLNDFILKKNYMFLFDSIINICRFVNLVRFFNLG